MPIIQRNTNSLSNLVYTTGVYINPPWITSLSAAKVGSGISQWNASQLRGYPIYTGIPSSGQVLAWTSSGWFPSGVTSSSVATGVNSFNSRTGVVTLTSADVTGALTYEPYNNTNPSGYISSGYYTASNGIAISGSSFSMSGIGTLSELRFDSPNDIVRIGENAGNAVSGYGISNIYIGQDAGRLGYNNYYNQFIGYQAGYISNNSHVNVAIGPQSNANTVHNYYSIMIGANAGDSSKGVSKSIFIGDVAGYAASGANNIYIGERAGAAVILPRLLSNNNFEISSTGSIQYFGLENSILAGQSNKINIQETIIGDNTKKKLAIGDVGINNLNPNATLEIIAKSSVDRVLIVKSAISQSVNLFEAQSSSGTTLFSVSNSGYITTPSSGLATWNASQLKGYPVSGNVPATGQVLSWNGNSWYAADVTAGGDHIIGDIYASPSGKIFTGNVLLNGAISGVLSNTTITPIDSTPYASGDCIKYIIKAKYGSAVQATEVLVVSNGTDSYMTEYGVLYSSGKLLDVSADFNSSNIRLLGQATYSNTSIHMMKVLIA